MAIERLNTSEMEDTAIKFRNSISEFGKCCDRMEKITGDLLSSWEGKGKNQYETQYRILKGKLADINDELYDIYEELIEAEAAYGEADVKIAKKMRCK